MHKNHDEWIGQLARIKNSVCAEFNITLLDLESKRRSQPLIAPRHICMWLCRKLTLASLPVIGRSIGDRDHTTVIYGIRNAEDMMSVNAELRMRVENFLSRWNNEKAAQ